MNNEFKQRLQEREFAVLKDAQRVILKWATGCGKSKMTIDLINNALPSFNPSKPVRVLFLVAERAHINNWQDEMFKWHLRLDRVATDVVCYASLRKIEHNSYDIIVMDEAHHAFTEKRLASIENLSKGLSESGYVFLLSATLPSCNIEVMDKIFGKFKTSTVTLKDAIEGDILPDPRVYVIEMNLDNIVPNQTIMVGKDPNAPEVRWEDRKKYILRKRPCIIKCTEYQKNLYMTNDMEYWKQRYERSHSEFMRTKWVNIGSQRKQFLGNLKTSAVRNLLRSFPKKRRYVCFCSSVAQATELSKDNTISSKRTAKHNQEIIDAFNKKAINNIYAVGMITEGMNLTDIQTGIIVQLDGKERLFVQKCGRALRAEDPVVFIFYYKNTQDEVYLKGALENLDEKYIRHININQLNTIKL